ncbi:MAG: hypothetical protein KA007_03535 [Candidatus Pacebacteria bacterium]|nr:hypothetical protein [Candidatus Paceibacterota bacterium]
MKKLVIINGVTGAIGSACLAYFGSKSDHVVYGISRKAKDYNDFCENGKLPIATLICSISKEEYPPRMADYFSRAIPAESFSEIYYIHAIGVYPFEVNSQGNHIVHFDDDMDGIDDRCGVLTKSLFSSFYSKIPSVTGKRMRSFIFGSLADKHEPTVHASWWKTIKRLKDSIVEEQKTNMPGIVSVVNISSVLCPNELISRPFVFSKTDALPEYWLQPSEVAHFVGTLISVGQSEKFKEYEFFKNKPEFESDYYKDEKFTPRKMKELFGK